MLLQKGSVLCVQDFKNGYLMQSNNCKGISNGKYRKNLK